MVPETDSPWNSEWGHITHFVSGFNFAQGDIRELENGNRARMSIGFIEMHHMCQTHAITTIVITFTCIYKMECDPLH